MAVVVCGALFARRFGEEEGTPVADAADDAAGGEDDVACCACDSECMLDGLGCGGGCWGMYSFISFMPRPGRT